jgi:hypothetical protein
VFVPGKPFEPRVTVTLKLVGPICKSWIKYKVLNANPGPYVINLFTGVINSMP